MLRAIVPPELWAADLGRPATATRSAAAPTTGHPAAAGQAGASTSRVAMAAPATAPCGQADKRSALASLHRRGYVAVAWDSREAAGVPCTWSRRERSPCPERSMCPVPVARVGMLSTAAVAADPVA